MTASKRFKRARLRALAGQRKRDTSFRPRYTNLADHQDGYYECPHVSPFTLSARNVEADVFVMLQDWSSSEWLNRNRSAVVRAHGHEPSLPTNRRLQQYLLRYLGVPLAGTYATNLFPFVKPGPLSQKIPQRVLTRAARCYAMPQVRRVGPTTVVCLGLQTYNAVRESLGRAPYRAFRNALRWPTQNGATTFFCVPHTGALGELGSVRYSKQPSGHWWRQVARHCERHRRSAAAPAGSGDRR